MDTEKNIKDDILLRAEKVLDYNNRLIKQCDSWLSAEEGNRNMEKQIEVRRKNKIGWVRKFFRELIIDN